MSQRDRKEPPAPTSDITPREMVDDLLDLVEGMTEWEIDFAEGVDRRLLKGQTLNANQLDKLTEIHNDRVIQGNHATSDEEQGHED